LDIIGTEFYLVWFLESKEKIVICCTSYNLGLLKSPNINTFWESCNNFFLEHKNSMKPMEFGRWNIRLWHAKISYLEGLKFESYIKWKITQQNCLQIKVSKRYALYVWTNFSSRIYFGWYQRCDKVGIYLFLFLHMAPKTVEEFTPQ
jgi:hypothetical protein